MKEPPPRLGKLTSLLAVLGQTGRDRQSLLPPRDTDDIPAEVARLEYGRGRRASGPARIPGRGWKDILARVWRRVGADNCSLIAAGVAFYAMLAIFPALAAFVSIFTIVANPGTVREAAIQLSALVPSEAAGLLIDALTALISKANSRLSVAFMLSLAIAVWSARAGLAAMMTGLNIAYQEKEKRSFLRQQMVALVLTFGAFVLAGLAVGALAVIPAFLASFPLPDSQRTVVSVTRWPVLAVLVMIGISILYRVGPSRRQPKWIWISWGATLATAVWLLSSAGFSFYVARFGSYDAMYGSLGAVVVLLLWLWLGAFIVLIGATLNAEAEHQTLRDSTVGSPKPLGERGARMADTVGRSL